MVAAVVVGGTWQHSKAETSGALGANVCPTLDAVTYLPSIVPVAEVNWQGCAMTATALQGAYLWGANLTGVNLSGANLSFTNLSTSNLSFANLTNANLYGANGYANLYSVTYNNTTCPNGKNSNNTAGTCAGQGGGL